MLQPLVGDLLRGEVGAAGKVEPTGHLPPRLHHVVSVVLQVVLKGHLPKVHIQIQPTYQVLIRLVQVRPLRLGSAQREDPRANTGVRRTNDRRLRHLAHQTFIVKDLVSHSTLALCALVEANAPHDVTHGCTLVERVEAAVEGRVGYVRVRCEDR